MLWFDQAAVLKSRFVYSDQLTGSVLFSHVHTEMIQSLSLGVALLSILFWLGLGTSPCH